MYRYDEFDQRVVDDRVVQFRDQTRRFLAGELTEDEFRPLRLQNGLYIQKHAPMLRVAIPYGLLSTTQLRTLAHISRKYDRGYGHFTTRQNLQFNWPRLEDVPEILAELAQVEMHAIQTSGNCVRNITSDPLAGIAADEIVDPRPWAELIRQWSTLNPEFAFLPRKFKIAVTGATNDRTAALVHDIGAQAVRNEAGKTGFRIFVGGGQGRTPMIGYVIREFLPAAELLNYFDAILRVYNRYGRRDNIYKARVKILVKELTPAEFTRQVEAEWERLKGGPGTVPREEITRFADRTDYIGQNERAAGLTERHDLVVRLIERRTNQIIHGRIHDQKFLLLGSLAVQQASEQYARGADNRPPRLDHHGEVPSLNLLSQLPDERADFRGRVGGPVGDPEAAAEIQVSDPMPLRTQPLG